MGVRRRHKEREIDALAVMEMTLRPGEHHREAWERHGAQLLRDSGPTSLGQPLAYFGPPIGWTASDQHARDELAPSEHREWAEKRERIAFQPTSDSE